MLLKKHHLNQILKKIKETFLFRIIHFWEKNGIICWFNKFKEYDKNNFSKIIEQIVLDWNFSQSYKEGIYKLGLKEIIEEEIFSTNNFFQTISEKCILKKFDKNYIKTHDKKTHAHLFDIKIDKNKSELISCVCYDIQKDKRFDNSILRKYADKRNELLKNIPFDRYIIY